jgi:diguanylate cyclase (GGDEF)-like protein/hemerythrin-like metal-binding protein
MSQTTGLPDPELEPESMAANLARAQQQIAMLTRTIERLETEQLNLSNELMAKNRLLGEIVVRDEMTGLYNRQFITQRSQEEIERSSRYGTALSLMLFRLDSFRRLADTFGFDTSDRVLLRIANSIASHIRKPDLLARWDNETFAILMPHTTLESGMRSAERMRRVVADLPHPDVGPVTASFGVAEHGKHETGSVWFRNVDRSMQQAAVEGGNCIRGNEGGPLRDPVAMVRFAWRPEWNSGNRMIDRQHRELLDMANDLMDMVMTQSHPAAVRSALDNLVAHIQHHFWDEERILERVGYPEVAAHAQCHVDLLEEASRFEDRFLAGSIRTAELFSFIADTVILGHMLKEDILYFPATKAAAPELTAERPDMT